MSGARIIVLEDDHDLRKVIVRGLTEEGFDVRGVATGSDLLSTLDTSNPHALILDIGLPDADGRDVCQAIRASGSQVPILFLTAKDALTDRLAGFNAGGDDYITKPFAFDELVARMRVLVRRGGADITASVGSLRLDPAAHAAWHGEERIPLTPTEFRLLGLLTASPGIAIRRRELVRAGWPHGAIVHDNTLDAYIARLRRKLRPLDDAPQIATVHGVGYRLD